MAREFGIQLPPGAGPTTVLSVYPTQLYEVAMGLVMFGILWRLRDHKHAEGWLFGVYCVLAGIERFIVEFFRAKDDRFFGRADVRAADRASAFVVFGVDLDARVLACARGVARHLCIAHRQLRSGDRTTESRSRRMRSASTYHSSIVRCACGRNTLARTDPARPAPTNRKLRVSPATPTQLARGASRAGSRAQRFLERGEPTPQLVVLRTDRGDRVRRRDHRRGHHRRQRHRPLRPERLQQREREQQQQRQLRQHALPARDRARAPPTCGKPGIAVIGSAFPSCSSRMPFPMNTNAM